MELRTGIVIQARVSSTRLPKKIIIKIDNDITFLDILLSSLKKAVSNMPIILATTNNKCDQILGDYAKRHSIPCYRGSEQNVLQRFIECAEKFNLNTVIRVCSDNPFIDTSLIEELCTNYKGEDYLSYKINGQPSILTHYGFFAEIVSVKALKRVYNIGKTDCIEHVTNCIYSKTKDFEIRFIEKSINNTNIRCTLDTPNDFSNLRKIYNNWYKKQKQEKLRYTDFIEYIESNPDLEKNMKVEIKMNSK